VSGAVYRSVVTVLVAPSSSVKVVVPFSRYFVLAFRCIVEWYI